jgi:hypothetical protein
MIDVEHAMVMKELHEIASGKPLHLLWTGRPNRRTHRNEVVFDKFPRILLCRDIVAEGGVWVLVFQHGWSRAVKAKNVADHAMKRGAQQVAALSEQGVQ